MKYHLQKYPRWPGDPIFGDCNRTAVACVLDMERDEVPHFFDREPAGQRDSDAMDAARSEWLAAQGIAQMRFPFVLVNGNSLDDTMGAIGQFNPGRPHILNGCCIEGRVSTAHSVVWQDGRMIHNPNGLQRGVTAPIHTDEPGKQSTFWVEFLIREGSASP